MKKGKKFNKAMKELGKGLIDMQKSLEVKAVYGENVYRPTEKEKERYNNFRTTLRSAISFRQEYDREWEECVERYKAKPFFHEDGRAGVVLPIGKLIIETAQAQESKNPPTFAYSASKYKEDVKKAELLEFVVKKHVWNREYVNLDYKMDILNQDKMILGTMYQYIGWRTLYRTKHEIMLGEDGEFLKDGNGDLKLEKCVELHYDDVVVDNLYPQDVWLHPLATCVADSPWAYIRKRYDASTFLEMTSDNEFYKNIEYVKPGSFFEGWDNGGQTLWRQIHDANDMVVVMEKWDKIKDEVTIYANNVEIYYGPNPYNHKEIPLADFRNRLQYNTYLGESEMQRISTIADALNAFINIAIDKEKRAASGLNLMDNNLSDVDDVTMLFDPTKAFRVDDPKNSFVHYEMPGMNSSTNTMIQMLMDFLVYATGIDYRQISDLASSTKATVAALRREIAQQRINLNVNRNENCGVKRQGWLIGRMVMQYYTQPLLERLSARQLGKDGNDPKLETGKLSYRQIRIGDYEIEEKAEKGKYKTDSLRIKGKKDGAVSFFEARPEYLGLLGDIDVRVVPGSTMAAIAELQKTKAQEYIKVATEVLEPPTEEGAAPKPYLSIKYGLEEYVKSMGYDLDRAFDTNDKEGETAAMDEAGSLLNTFSQALGVPDLSQTKSKGLLPANLPAPKQPAANIAGVQTNNPLLTDLASEMGNANRMTNKPQ